jgi:hypothetical protein
MPIQKVDDPLILELERIATQDLVIPCTFLHANLFEANFGLDQIAADAEISFPVLLHVANGKNDNKQNVASDVIRKASVYGMLLQRYDNKATSDYSSKEANGLVYAMQQLADNLQYWVNKSRLSVGCNSEGEPNGASGFKLTDVYGKFDADLFGVAFEFV